MTTAFFTDSRSHEHTLEGHPEHAGRLMAIQARLKEAGIPEQCRLIEAREATLEEIGRVHQSDYLEVLAWTSTQTRLMGLDSDTYITPSSYFLARIAAGGLLNVVEAVLDKRADNGLAAIRPPGHHATPQRGMGFCLLNNIAIAARHAQHTGGLSRVAIVDFDVHHGNGTQDAFYNDPSVYFISSHQSPLYPGTGSLHEIGAGEGRGATMNIPLPPGVGDADFERLYLQVVLPALERFQPELILVSAGFDAHWRDPLANLQLSLTTFAFITRQLIQAAQHLCAGRIIFVTEGGYDLEALNHGVLNIAYALLGQATVSDPLGAARSNEPLPDSYLRQLLSLHQLS